MQRGKWLRVSREHPCPVCGKPDWCLYTADGDAAICPRTESGRDLGEAGFLHRLREDPAHPLPAPKVATRPVLPDLSKLAEKFKSGVTDASLGMLAERLGKAITVASLKAFGVGWSGKHMAWTIPSLNPLLGVPTGIQLRRLDGSKLSVKGSRYALYSPRQEYPDTTLLVCEGASDALAAHSLGFGLVAGRHNCRSGIEYIVHLARTRKPTRVVIVADNDGNGVGLEGAMQLAEKLAYHHKDVVVFLPPDPHNDLRAWANAGATRADVEGRR